MRVAGYVLVFLGLLFLFVMQCVGSSERRAIELGRDVKWIGERESIPKDDVLKHLGETNRMWAATQSSGIYGALAMLVGAVLLDLAAKKHSRTSTAKRKQD